MTINIPSLILRSSSALSLRFCTKSIIMFCLPDGDAFGSGAEPTVDGCCGAAPAADAGGAGVAGAGL